MPKFINPKLLASYKVFSKVFTSNGAFDIVSCCFIQEIETSGLGFCRSKVAIFVTDVNKPINQRVNRTLFVSTYVFGIKHKPFTFIDYVNVMRPMYEGAVMRSGGMRRGELSVFVAGRKCGKSIATYDYINSLTKIGE